MEESKFAAVGASNAEPALGHHRNPGGVTEVPRAFGTWSVRLWAGQLRIRSPKLVVSSEYVYLPVHLSVRLRS